MPTITLDVASSVGHRKQRAHYRLEQLARPLHPARAPYFLRVEDRPPTLRKTFPATGWYWRPADHPVAVFLGRNEFEARDELLELLRREEAAADA